MGWRRCARYDAACARWLGLARRDISPNGQGQGHGQLAAFNNPLQSTSSTGLRALRVKIRPMALVEPRRNCLRPSSSARQLKAPAMFQSQCTYRISRTARLKVKYLNRDTARVLLFDCVLLAKPQCAAFSFPTPCCRASSSLSRDPFHSTSIGTEQTKPVIWHVASQSLGDHCRPSNDTVQIVCLSTSI